MTGRCILGYHSVSAHRSDALAVRTDVFDAQLAWLRARWYRSLTLAQYLAEPVQRGERIVILTFDDGYRDNFTEALPVLRKHGYVGTFFVVSEPLGTDHTFYWDEPKIAAGAPRNLFGVMSWEQVHELAESGMEIGSHTATHPELTRLTHEQCRDEIVRSRRDLTQALGREIVSFCYPRGLFDERITQLVEEAGYSCAVVSPERHGIPLGMHTLRRIGVHHGNGPLVFRLKASRLVRRNHERLMRLRSA